MIIVCSSGILHTFSVLLVLFSDSPSTVAPHAERKFTAIMRDHRANDAEVKVSSKCSTTAG